MFSPLSLTRILFLSLCDRLYRILPFLFLHVPLTFDRNRNNKRKKNFLPLNLRITFQGCLSSFYRGCPGVEVNK